MFYKLNSIVLLIILSSCSLVETEIQLVASDVTYVYDGDTITFNCIEGYFCVKNKTKVRVKGVDTPEIKAECDEERVLARQAKQHAVKLLREAKKITLVIDDANPYDRYQRLLAYVYVDGLGLHESLVNNGLGRKYHGNKRESWC